MQVFMFSEWNCWNWSRIADFNS